MEPIGTNVFFLAPWAMPCSGDYRDCWRSIAAARFTTSIRSSAPSPATKPSSNIATPSPAELRTAGHNYPTHSCRPICACRNVDPRVADLLQQITESANNDYDKASAIENYLRTPLRLYAATCQDNTVKDPIANFLFERKQGHCEYFASSMAVMLRTLGIPSRVVNGFRSDEFNDLTGNYIVRAKDAHSWVEAYFPGYGWQTFDPTPAGSARTCRKVGDGSLSTWMPWLPSGATGSSATTARHQYVLSHAAIRNAQSLGKRSQLGTRQICGDARLGEPQSGPRRTFTHSVGHHGGIVALMLLLLGNIVRIVRWLQERWVRAHPESSPEHAAVLWYQRMARVVAKRGTRKSAAQTPQEFVQQIQDTRLREPVSRFTDVYESARFGNSVDDAHRLPELYEEVESAAKTR